MENILQLHNVRKAFGSRTVLRGISLTVRSGEVVFLIGPSGSGKSTLLRCCNLLEKPNSGSIVFNGESITDSKNINDVRQSIGMVFQSFNLYPHMTALWNIVIALKVVQKVPLREAKGRAMTFLDRVGLADYASSYPTQLSGGQQQRVAIARTLALRPKLVLFDEPTSALDPELVGGVLDVMRDMRGDGMTMLIVSHEMQFAREAADNVAFMDDGLIVEQGPPAAIFSNPTQERTQSFLSRFNSV